MTLISVVLSAYNAEKYIQPALDSLINQTLKDFEIVVVDDGSKDRTKEILDSLNDPRLIKISNHTNIGLTQSLIKGISFSSGTYIARQDADDISHPERLRQQLAFMEAHPNVGLLGTAYQIIDEWGHSLDVVIPPESNAELQRRLEFGNIFCHGSVMFRKALYDEAGGYRGKFPVTQDYDLWLRLAEITELANLQAQLYSLRFNAASVSRKKRDVQLAYRRLAWELAQQRRTTGNEFLIPEDIPEAYPPEPWRLLKEALGNAYLYYVVNKRLNAKEQILTGYKIYKNNSVGSFSWADWCSISARKIAHYCNKVEAGSEFITWFYNILPSSTYEQPYHKIIADYFADQAFQAYQAGHFRSVLTNSIQTIKYDIKQLRNRGLWKIIINSISSSKSPLK